MAEDTRKQQLLELFTTITNKKTIVEPMRKVHGTLRDRDAVEREIALIMREILDKGYFKTKLAPRQLAKLVVAYYDGKNDTEIARALGDEKLSKTVALRSVTNDHQRDRRRSCLFEQMKCPDEVSNVFLRCQTSDEPDDATVRRQAQFLVQLAAAGRMNSWDPIWNDRQAFVRNPDFIPIENSYAVGIRCHHVHSVGEFAVE